MKNVQRLQVAVPVSLTSNEGHSHKTQTNAYVINLMQNASCKSEESIDPTLMDRVIDCTFDPEGYPSLAHYIFRKLGKVETLGWTRIIKFEEIILQILLRGHERFYEEVKSQEHLVQGLLVIKRKERGLDSGGN